MTSGVNGFSGMLAARTLAAHLVNTIARWILAEAQHPFISKHSIAANHKFYVVTAIGSCQRNVLKIYSIFKTVVQSYGIMLCRYFSSSSINKKPLNFLSRFASYLSDSSHCFRYRASFRQCLPVSWYPVHLVGLSLISCSGQPYLATFLSCYT